MKQKKISQQEKYKIILCSGVKNIDEYFVLKNKIIPVNDKIWKMPIKDIKKKNILLVDKDVFDWFTLR